MLRSNLFLNFLPNYGSSLQDLATRKKRRRHTARYSSIIFSDRANRLNYPFALSYHPDSIDVEDDVFFKKMHENFRLFTAGNEKNNAGDIHRFYSIIFNLEQLKKNGVPGDFAELGVYKGNTAAILANYAKELGRRLFLLDTFAGFHSGDIQKQKHSGYFSDTDINSVKKLVGHDDICTYLMGRFPESITKELAARKFCFVSLDCDLYKPMKAGLEFFYPRLEPGGFLFIHDYFSPYWKDECARALDEFCLREGKNPVLLPDKSGTAVLQK